MRVALRAVSPLLRGFQMPQHETQEMHVLCELLTSVQNYTVHIMRYTLFLMRHDGDARCDATWPTSGEWC